MTSPSSTSAQRPWTGRLFIAVAGLAIMASACSTAKHNKIDDAKVDSSQKASAEKFGTDVLTAWARDEYPPVVDPATPEFKEGQSDVARQKAADKSIEAQLGDFQSMTFQEAYSSDPPKTVLYRFKAKFTKNDQSEVRVVYDKSGLLAGFWIKPWKDSL